MNFQRDLLLKAANVELPSVENSIKFIHSLSGKSVPDILARAKKERRLLIQPRCGVGSHSSMKALLQDLEAKAQPDILSLTIDSYTRLKKFDLAAAALKEDSRQLNGYPLVTHGWEKGRDLVQSISAPLEVRHGSPDAKVLFEVAIASGITSFEGGGIGYNLPYCKDFPIEHSLEAWDYIDHSCGLLAERGVVIDRELFGTLSAVLMPPSISLAMTLLEAILAARRGVKCISIAYPQGGHLEQDIAALQTIQVLAEQYLPADVNVYPVLHEFMGAFPKDRVEADALILFGALTAKLGGATKLISKTNQEAFGIPTTEANANGILNARMATTSLMNAFQPNREKIEEESKWILSEVKDIVDPLLAEPNLARAIVAAFANGRLDIPFATSKYAHSSIIPARDRSGAIRFLNSGNLPFSQKVSSRNRGLLSQGNQIVDPVKKVYADICFFSAGNYKSAECYES